jgi:hypothetical protein
MEDVTYIALLACHTSLTNKEFLCHPSNSTNVGEKFLQLPDTVLLVHLCP